VTYKVIARFGSTQLFKSLFLTINERTNTLVLVFFVAAAAAEDDDDDDGTKQTLKSSYTAEFEEKIANFPFSNNSQYYYYYYYVT
jgi:hypothetical protein